MKKFRNNKATKFREMAEVQLKIDDLTEKPFFQNVILTLANK